MLDNRKRRSANESSDDETLTRPRRRKAGAEEEIKLVPAPTEDSILLEENRFMAYTDRYMNNDLYEDEPRQERFFFPDENQNMDEEEEDDFDDDFDEDFEELSDEEFTQLIDGDGGDDEEADADDSCAENSADPEADEWDSLDSEENVFEED
ncbi:MAG: hypothetical protein IJM54_04755 [Thermoguttaceae bacterium]|nr:hypothetical protein [Thermoguttaceae bacterium]MBR4751719.1 hypothetical protein [Thermoguttaceae bacterium]